MEGVRPADGRICCIQAQDQQRAAEAQGVPGLLAIKQKFSLGKKKY